jgi:hypothetical protein
MTITIETLLAFLSLGALFVAFFLRLEHRLTRLETKIDLHCKETHQAK